MTIPNALYESKLNSLRRRSQGKVRDIYDVDDQTMLIVTTDRISAFDVILPNPIPGKGQVLTSVSNFWFEKMGHIIPNHLCNVSLDQIISNDEDRSQVRGRCIVVKKLKPLPIEAVVRGYLIGSGWNDYQRDGNISGIRLPTGLRQAEKLPDTLYTPSTKAELGYHDETITFSESVALIGQELAEKVRDTSLRLYSQAAAYALERGIIIADTKFEFGLDDNGDIYLIDEALTPDSSRFWPADQYRVGISPPSFDKQYIRDYLETLDWNKTEPGPNLPEGVIKKSAEKYREAERRLIA